MHNFFIILRSNQQLSLKEMRKFKKFMAEFDMFAASPTLRAKDQPQSSSIFSGIVSILFGLVFAYVFISSAVTIFTYQDIQSTQVESKLSGSAVKSKPLFFAIRVGYLPAAESLKYFDIGYFLNTENGSNITSKLNVCTKDQWAKLGDNYQQEFQQYQIGEFFCPDPAANLSLFKVYYAQNPRFIVIYIRPCSDRPDCQNQTVHREVVQNLTDEEGAVFLLAYFLDEVINPQSKNPISYTINTDVELAFTTKRGIIATVQFASYQIKTDIGFMPVQQIVIDEGNFVNSFRETSIELKSLTDNYAFIYLGMNRRYIYIERKVGKIDEMLSYAGGLFSIIIGFLAIFMNSYNQYRYELMVAEGIFHEDEDGNRIREDDFTFTKYIKYEIFDWVETMFCFKMDWKDCLMVDSTREEANCHLDVTRLFRKIQTMDSSLLHVIDRGEKDCLALVKPQSLGKIKRNRLILEYYEAIVQGKPVLTLEEYVFSKRILKFGLWLSKQHDDPTSYKVSNSNSDIIYEMNQDEQELQQLEDKNKVLQIIFTKFPDIESEALKIQLPQELLEIEQELAESFSELEPEARFKIQERIPIIIMQRLKKYISLEQLSRPGKKANEGSEEQIVSERVKRRKNTYPLIVQFDRPKSN